MLNLEDVHEYYGVGCARRPGPSGRVDFPYRLDPRESLPDRYVVDVRLRGRPVTDDQEWETSRGREVHPPRQPPPFPRRQEQKKGRADVDTEKFSLKPNKGPLPGF